MQHLRGRVAKSDGRTYVRTTYVRTYASSTVSRHFGAETKTGPSAVVEAVLLLGCQSNELCWTCYAGGESL